MTVLSFAREMCAGGQRRGIGGDVWKVAISCRSHWRLLPDSIEQELRSIWHAGIYFILFLFSRPIIHRRIRLIDATLITRWSLGCNLDRARKGKQYIVGRRLNKGRRRSPSLKEKSTNRGSRPLPRD